MDQCELLKESQLCNRLTIICAVNVIVLHQMKNMIDLYLVFFLIEQ
jgi:hypothetical protein